MEDRSILVFSNQIQIGIQFLKNGPYLSYADVIIHLNAILTIRKCTISIIKIKIKIVPKEKTELSSM